MPQPLVFVSYSHKDEVEKERLRSHLGVVLETDLTSLWSDDHLGAGVDWELEISRAIGQAKVAILLITADFLNSKFILQKEVKTLLERRETEGLHVFPVIAKACAWNRVEWLKKMNVRPRNGKPVWSDGGTHVEEDLASIAEEVSVIIEKEKNAPAPPPAQDASSSPKKTPPPEGKPANKSESLKVLLVDDDPLFRRSVKYGLKSMNITLSEAGSVEEGRHLLDDNRDIQIILLDLLLPGEDGTNLLEYIKGRASDYRVIILTGHDELLAAEKAAAYNVFSYLSKGEKFPAQMLRFAIEGAYNDLKRNAPGENQELSEDLLKMYPTPFLYIYQHLKSDIPPLKELVSQKDMFELLLHFSAVVLLCEYLYGDARSDDLDTQIRSRIYKPSLGDWFNIINEIVKRRDDFSKTFFLDAFLTFYTGRNKKNIGELIGIRNKYVGHGPQHSDYETESIVKRCNELLTPLLQDFQFITHFLLCYALSVQKIKSGYVYSLKECTGANSQLFNLKRDFNFLLDAQEMHLVNLDTEQYQSLHPFIILENCDECKQPEIFFYSKFSNDQLHYLSYKTGHWITKGESAGDFLKWIKED
jgi:CheY-like chemotaxis protein